MPGMSTHAVTLEEKYFRVVKEKARALGKTPEQYLQALIDADSRSFDDILKPVRRGFDKMSDKETDSLIERAQKFARRKRK